VRPTAPLVKQAIEKYIQYLQSVRHASPHTISNYGKDLAQFVGYLSPPETQPPSLLEVTHTMIREFVGHLHDQGLEKSSIARKLAALRSFFKYCVREGLLKESPAGLVPTPKLPKRVPSVMSAEEMNGFLNQLADWASSDRSSTKSATKRQPRLGKASSGEAKRSSDGTDDLLLLRDRALLELLYAAGLRVSELTGLNWVDIDQNERMLRVRGKGNKERIVPYGTKAQDALDRYWPLRDKLMMQPGRKRSGLSSNASGIGGAHAHGDAVFLNYA